MALNVITGEDFKTYHYSAIDDAFRNIPGVNVVQQGSYGKLSSLSIRGANANQVLILVDGVRVSSPTLGQTDLSDISPDLIERIEVIRGGQSTLYGADAIGGVVNIITKKGTGPFSATVENMGGNYDTFQQPGLGQRHVQDLRLLALRARTSRATGSSRTTTRTSTR